MCNLSSNLTMTYYSKLLICVECLIGFPANILLWIRPISTHARQTSIYFQSLVAYLRGLVGVINRQGVGFSIATVASSTSVVSLSGNERIRVVTELLIHTWVTTHRAVYSLLLAEDQ